MALSIRTSGPRLCDGMSRREAIRIGGLSSLGLSLPAFFAKAPVASGSPADLVELPVAGKAKSCILLFLLGGPPQHSTWDPKPEAPEEVRGEFGPTSTNVPGVQFCELLPKLSQQADKLAVLRAVSTGDNAHSSSGYYMLTGQPHSPMNRENANPGAPNDWPCLGAVVKQLAEPRGELPSAMRLPMHIFNTDGSVWPGQDSGFLGRSADPWLVRCEPASAEYHIPEFKLPVDVTLDRLGNRFSLLREMNQQLDAASRSQIVRDYDGLTQRAFGLLSSGPARQAFDLDREPAGMRERYGSTQFGQSVLLARRMIEAGVRLVQVNWFRGPEEPAEAPCWDSHAKEAERLKTVLAPPLDQAFSALVEDLAQRGMLDETLVVCMAEFGRTPRFNGRAGRDHWGPVFSIAMAGGGVRGGVVHGASDHLGAQPKDGMVKPEDVAATIFHSLGFPPGSLMRDPQGRTISISHGRVISEILS